MLIYASTCQYTYLTFKTHDKEDQPNKTDDIYGTGIKMLSQIWHWCFLLLGLKASNIHYEPTWESIDSRPLPSWYDEAKFGIFIHWGVFSVPSYADAVVAWFWYNWKHHHYSDYEEFMKKNYPPGFTYADFAPLFKAELYNPDEWVEILKASGAK